MTDKTDRKPDTQALLSDGTALFVNPMQPEPGDTVQIRLRTGKKNVDAASLIVFREEGGTWERIPMERLDPDRGDGFFDWFRGELQPEGPVAYCFEIVLGDRSWWYLRSGVLEAADCMEKGSGELDLWLLAPGFRVPAWTQGAVMYQIFVDRFRNGDPSNDVLTDEYVYDGHRVRRAAKWDALPEPDDIGRFYGGDLQGVIDSLDYLSGLGIEVLYLNPIFLSPSNHKYDTQDYRHVDPHFGRIVRDGGRLLPKKSEDNSRAARYLTRVQSPENLEASDALLAELTAEAHRRGIRVILDGVFNHCGAFHRWMDREGIYGDGAYWNPDSPYRAYFRFEDPDAVPEDGTDPEGKGESEESRALEDQKEKGVTKAQQEDGEPDNSRYESWWGFSSMPKLNYEGSEQLVQEILSTAVKWISPPYSADGWRLDVASDVGHSRAFNHAFWRRFRETVRNASPEALIVAENYTESEKWLRGGEWDTIMNYEAFMDPVSWFLTGMEKHCDEYRPEMVGDVALFWDAMNMKGRGPLPVAPRMAAMNQLSNHDHARFLTRTRTETGRLADLGSKAASEGVDRAVLRQAVILQMTWPGAPTLYYGEEAGLCGFTDPDNRRTYPWGKEDADCMRLYREAIRLRRDSRVLREGALVRLPDAEGILAYARLLEGESVLVLLNRREEPALYRENVACAGLRMRRNGTARFEVLLRSSGEGLYSAAEQKAAQALTTAEGGELSLMLPAKSAVVLRWKQDV